MRGAVGGSVVQWVLLLQRKLVLLSGNIQSVLMPGCVASRSTDLLSSTNTIYPSHLLSIRETAPYTVQIHGCPGRRKGHGIDGFHRASASQPVSQSASQPVSQSAESALRKAGALCFGGVCWFYQHTLQTLDPAIFYPKHCFSPILKTHPIDILSSDSQSAHYDPQLLPNEFQCQFMTPV
jgi:hypothetical protein